MNAMLSSPALPTKAHPCPRRTRRHGPKSKLNPSRSGLWVLIALIIASPGGWAAEKKRLEPTKTWSGSNDNELPQPGPPHFITNSKALEKLWADWKVADAFPQIDFTKELVVLSTTSGSRLNLMVLLDETGNLAVNGISTRDFRPGFRYVIAVVPRAGILTCQGQPLPKE